MTTTPPPTRDFDDLLRQLREGAPDNPDAEWQAAIALGQVTDPGERERAIPALIASLADPASHALIRTHCAESLGALGDARAVPALRAALADPYRLVRAYAVPGFARLAPPLETISVLRPLAESDPYFGVRAEAIAAIAALAQRSADSILRAELRNWLLARRTTESAERGTGSERILAEIERGLDGL